MGELPLAPAQALVELEEMHRGVMYADADARFTHVAYEGRPFEVARQGDLEHVPVRVREILGRQLAADRAVPEREITPRERLSPFRKFFQGRKLSEADARGDVRQIPLAAQH